MKARRRFIPLTSSSILSFQPAHWVAAEEVLVLWVGHSAKATDSCTMALFAAGVINGTNGKQLFWTNPNSTFTGKTMMSVAALEPSLAGFCFAG